jgi:hypothetical protein
MENQSIFRGLQLSSSSSAQLLRGLGGWLVAAVGLQCCWLLQRRSVCGAEWRQLVLWEGFMRCLHGINHCGALLLMLQPVRSGLWQQGLDPWVAV